MAINSDANGKEKGLGGLWIIVVINVLLLVPWGVAAMFLPMGFGAPGAQNSIAPYIAISIVLFYPVLVVVTPFIALHKLATGEKLVELWVALPLIYTGVLVLLSKLALFVAQHFLSHG